MTQIGLGYSANLLNQYNVTLPKTGFVGTLSNSISKLTDSSLFKSFSGLANQVNMLDNISKQPATLLYNPPAKNIAANLIQSNILPASSSTMYNQLPMTPMLNTNTTLGGYCNKAIGINNSIFGTINNARNSIYGKITGVGSNLLSKLGSTGIGQAAKGLFGAVKGFGSSLVSKVAGTAFGKAAGAIGGKLLGAAAAALNFIPGIGTIASIALTLFGGKIFNGVGKLVKGLVGGVGKAIGGIAKGVCNVAKKVGKFLKKL